MSGGVIFQAALRILREKSLLEVAERDVVAALERARPGPLNICWSAGTEAGLSRHSLLLRSAAIFFCYGAGSLADDLADGDCDYLEPRAGPGAQFILQNLFFETLARTGLDSNVLSAVCADMVAAAAPQQMEVRTTSWTFESMRVAAEGLVGLQYSAFFRVLWAGTPLEQRATELGMDLGVACQVSEDIRSSDPRVATLPPADRRECLDWLSQKIDRLHRAGLECIEAALRDIEPVLRAARSKTI
jgi:hypothetical protein